MMKSLRIFVAIFCLFSLGSCNKEFLNIEPESVINSDQLGTSAEGTLGALRGIYAGLRSYGLTGYAGHEDYGHKSILSVVDLMGNDVVMYYLNWNGFNYNYTGRVMTNSRAHMPWFTYYTQIKNANIVVNSIDEGTDDAELRAVRGQALALRGYFHFMLARIYGPTYVGNESKLSVPIHADEESTKRNTVQEVYAQIESDLTTAVAQLEGRSEER